MNLLQLWQQQFLRPCHGKNPFLGGRRETSTKGVAGGCVLGNPWGCGNPRENELFPGLDGLAVLRVEPTEIKGHMASAVGKITFQILQRNKYFCS